MTFLSNFKQWTVCHILMCITLIISGLVINFVQLILYLSIGIGLGNRQLFRKINYYFVWMIYAQVLFLADWWSGSELHIYCDDETKRKIGTEHGLIIMNHHYELDWLFGWMGADRFHVLGNARVYVKKMLKYIPVFGWAWSFSDVVFLEREWNKDKENLKKGIENLMNYPDPMWLLIFAEGTRFSKEKHEASQEFAKSRGLPDLKHHLIPRVKGIARTLESLDTSKVEAIYDITMVVNEKEGHPATLSNILQGKKTVGEVYIRRIPTASMKRDEASVTEFLMRLYSEKDALKDSYLQTGCFSKQSGFPQYEPFCHGPRIPCLLNTIILNTLIGVPLVKLFFSMLLSGSMYQVFGAVAAVSCIFVAMRKLIGLTKMSKASAYGKSKAD